MNTGPERCIVNVATDEYVALQGRLLDSLKGWPHGLAVWTGRLPEGSPSHEDAPYAFKLHAIAEAAGNHRLILWLDSPCVISRPLDPVFEEIEREGHVLASSGERLGNWASDECLSAFGLTRDAAMDLPLMNGTLIGLDMANARTRRWFDELFDACRRGLFRGPYLSDHAPAEVRARKPGKPVGFVSADPRCWGHRHDEAVGSCLAHRLGLNLTKQTVCFVR